ncbi:unknown [Sutterella wadsworthensis CAG:135]|nr:unknown [Sutterella wadsworthensis CAG:135]
MKIFKIQIDHFLDILQTRISSIGNENIFIEIKAGIRHSMKNIGECSDVIDSAFIHVRKDNIARTLVANHRVIDLLQVGITLRMTELCLSDGV